MELLEVSIWVCNHMVINCLLIMGVDLLVCARYSNVLLGQTLAFVCQVIRGVLNLFVTVKCLTLVVGVLEASF
jgi:putative copper export protein